MMMAIVSSVRQTILRSYNCFSRNKISLKTITTICGCRSEFSGSRCLSSATGQQANVHNSYKSYLEASDDETEAILSRDMIVHEDFLSEEEEKSLFDEFEPYMKRLRYEFDHWDNAIHGYRETERKTWNEKNTAVLERVKDLAFPPGTPKLAHVHILDLSKEGYIKPHIDAVRFCGSTIAGLCLLSPCVMRLVSEKDKNRYGDVLLRQRSLYIMKDVARFQYTHEVLPETMSCFRGQFVSRERRVSVICRNEPEDDQS